MIRIPPLIPISAQLKFNIDAILENLVTKLNSIATEAGDTLFVGVDEEDDFDSVIVFMCLDAAKTIRTMKSACTQSELAPLTAHGLRLADPKQSGADHRKR